MIALLRQAADPGDREGAQWAGMRIHRIASEMLTELGASSKLNAEWEFFSLLYDEGRKSAQVFLKNYASDIGRSRSPTSASRAKLREQNSSRWTSRRF